MEKIKNVTKRNLINTIKESNKGNIVICNNYSFLSDYNIDKNFTSKVGKNFSVLNFKEPEYSARFNPFSNFSSNIEIINFSKRIINFISSDGESDTLAQATILSALMLYLFKYRPKEEQNFTSIMKLLHVAKVDENNSNVKSPLDRIFDEIEKRDPGSIAFKQYQIRYLLNGTEFNFHISRLYSYFSIFNEKSVGDFSNHQNIDFRNIFSGEENLIIILPDNDSNFAYIKEMFILCFKERYNSYCLETLKYPILNFFMDKKIKQKNIQEILDDFLFMNANYFSISDALKDGGDFK